MCTIQFTETEVIGDTVNSTGCHDSALVTEALTQVGKQMVK